MAGVRIRHLTAHNVRFTIVEKDNPYKTLYQCTPPEFGGCGRLHTHKTHHLTLDDQGTVIIDAALFQKVRGHLEANGFSIVEEVKKPPTMGIGVGEAREGTGAWGNIPIVDGE